MRSVVCVLVVVVMSMMTVFAADPAEVKYEVSVNGTQRTFYVYVPSSYTGATAFPLLVFFHGASDSCQESTNFMIAGFTMQQVARRFLLVGACGINKMWSGPTDLPFAETILDTMAHDYAVDPSRIYSSGFSNGAGLSNYMACRIPNRWTGGVSWAAGSIMTDSFSSNQTNAQMLAQCDTLFAQAGVKVNVLKLQGEKDPAAIPYGRSGTVTMRDDFYGWALRNGCKGSPTTVAETNVFKDERFQDCPPHVTVRLVMLYGIPHQWVQNATFNYNTVILDNFEIGSPSHSAHVPLPVHSPHRVGRPRRH